MLAKIVNDDAMWLMERRFAAIASKLVPTENPGHKKGRCKAAAEGRR
ncbi:MULTISPECIES: hypothetical protein [Pseudomonas]|nr:MULTISPECIES: hypothetical protein [Pseudomonas]